jgi:hypothetical protein
VNRPRAHLRVPHSDHEAQELGHVAANNRTHGSAKDPSGAASDRFHRMQGDQESLIIERSAVVQPEPADIAVWLCDQHVFVSSVIEGMAELRSAAADAIEASGAKSVLFEHFGGRDDDPERAYLSELGRCTIYVGILGERYGRPLPSGYSATHAEYNEAQRFGLRNSIWVSKGDHDGRQNDFINEIAVFHTYGAFEDPQVMAKGITRRLRDLAAEDLSPWAKLGPIVFRARRVRVEGNKIAVEAISRDDEVSAGFSRLHDRRVRSGDLFFTHDLSSVPVDVAGIVTDTTAGNSRRFELTLNRRGSSGSSGLTELAVEGRTPEDITELALRVALFGEANPLGTFSFMANVPNPFDQVRQLCLSEEIVGPIVRVLLTETLVASGRAERITSLRLGPVHRGSRRLSLAWRPRQRYINAYPEERHIEGEVTI